MDSLRQPLIDFATLILTVCGPILVAFLAAWLKAKYSEAVAGMTNEQRAYFSWAVSVAVQAAEQSGLAGKITDKKAFAISAVENLLAQRGIKMDLQAIDDAIEAAVWTELNSYDPVKNKAVSNQLPPKQSVQS